MFVLCGNMINRFLIDFVILLYLIINFGKSKRDVILNKTYVEIDFTITLYEIQGARFILKEFFFLK